MENYLNLSTLYYDVSKPIGKSLGGDLEFYESHIEKSHKILEAGVGTGRLLIPYLKKGYNVEGIELSKDMLDMCKQKCEEHKVSTNLILGNVETYKFDAYDAILIPTGTFCLFHNIENVLKNFFNSLNDGGFILFDLIFPTGFKEGSCNNYRLVLDNGDVIILNDIHYDIDYTHQKTSELLKYEYFESGKLIESELQTFVINWYGINEMKHILKSLGFKNLEVFGDYQTFNDDLQYETVTIKAYK